MQIERVVHKISAYSEKLFRAGVVLGFAMTAVLMYVRAFFGTEITDEAYYVAEAKAILEGNIPFARNTTLISGFGLFLVPIVAVYRYVVPDMEGIFLATRLCFVTCKVLVSLIAYGVLAKQIKKENALILSAFILLLYGNVQNFSYNTIPQLCLLLAGILLYDAIEQDGDRPWCKIAIAGGAPTIACLANPGWGLAFVIFIGLVAARITEHERRAKALKTFLLACFVVLAAVFSFVVINASVGELLTGLSRTYIDPVPVDSLNPNKTWKSIFNVMLPPFKIWILYFLPMAFFLYLFACRYMREGEEKLSKGSCLAFSLTVALFFHIAYLLYISKKIFFSNAVGNIGFAMICWTFMFFLTHHGKKERIGWYLAIYPITYSIAILLIGEAGISIWRFSYCITIAIPLLYILFRNKSELVRLITTALSVVIIVFLGYLSFHDVYRDAHIRELSSKVPAGVYKGIYTTEARAHDLPEMEQYLCKVVSKNEIYNFRDNVPSGYLMNRYGKMCDVYTWDVFQYSYASNSPAILFDYYKRRGMIPDKIIYIDYGRDKQLSIDDPNFRYNDFVNAYYDLVEDIELNETFKRVKVYQYNGKFDGNYQYWIDAYWQPTKPKKSLF